MESSAEIQCALLRYSRTRPPATCMFRRRITGGAKIHPADFLDEVDWLRAAGLVRVAAQGKTQRGANLFHSLGSEVRHTPAQALLRHRHRVMKIHRARALHTIFFVQPHFRGNASDAGRDRCDRRRRQVTKCTVARQHDDWPCLVRRSKTVQPNVAPRYSFGQIASASHPDRPPDSVGLPS